MLPLPKEHYHKLSRFIDQITFNNLFARAVINQTVSGKVYVNDITDPQTWYIVHRYGMSLLGGDHTNNEFNKKFYDYAINKEKTRSIVEWMQVFPEAWNGVLKLPGLELNTRVNFVFDLDLYLRFRGLLTEDAAIEIVPLDANLFEKMNGSVVPKVFWDSFSDFISGGKGFCLYYDRRLAATAFSSFLAPGKLEIGIETVPEFRSKGLAERVCVALIDYCLANNLEPLWACRRENIGSYQLAKKLGFVVDKEMSYYRLGL